LNVTEKRFTYLRECAEKFKKSYQRSLFGIRTYNIIRVRDAERILSSSKHIDKSIIYMTLHPFLKTGLLTSKREKWFKRRRMLTPAFHFNILKEFCEIFK
jgi:cytochrome P450 family 4